jgi:hypothetical protein
MLTRSSDWGSLIQLKICFFKIRVLLILVFQVVHSFDVFCPKFMNIFHLRDEIFVQNIATFAACKLFRLSHSKTRTKVGEKDRFTQFLSCLFSLFISSLAGDFQLYYQSNAYVEIMKSRKKIPEPEPSQIDPPCLRSIRDYLYSVVSWWAAKCVGSTALWIVYWINVFLFLTNGANHVCLLFVLFPYWLTSTLGNFEMAPM